MYSSPALQQRDDFACEALHLVGKILIPIYTSTIIVIIQGGGGGEVEGVVYLIIVITFPVLLRNLV